MYKTMEDVQEKLLMLENKLLSAAKKEKTLIRYEIEECHFFIGMGYLPKDRR